MVVIGKSLLIFNDVTFKMAAWWPYWFFGFQTLTLVWFLISTPNLSSTILCICVGAYWVSAMLISKWPPGSHIVFFWFPDSNFSLALNINSKLKWHILVYMGRSLLIFSTSLSKWLPGGHIGFFGFRTNFSLALNINSKLQWQNTYIGFQWPHFLNGCLVAILDFSVSGWHGFSSVTQVCFGISVSKFMCMSFVAVGKSLTIVSYVNFKMAAL